MPDWAMPKGPWCLKQWVPFNVPNPTVDLCLLPPEHDGDCRGIGGTWHNYEQSLLVGQSKMKENNNV